MDLDLGFTDLINIFEESGMEQEENVECTDALLLNVSDLHVHNQSPGISGSFDVSFTCKYLLF